MARIFISPEQIKGYTAELPEAEARRLFKVLRLRPGDTVTLIDGGREYEAEISAISAKSVTLDIKSITERQVEPGLRVLLGQGVPKGDKLELVVQKAVELGVMAVSPVMMGRSVKRPEMDSADRKLERLRRVVVEAAQQSGRVCVPEVSCFMDLPMFLDLAGPFGLKIALYEGSKTESLRGILHGAGEVVSVALLVGPEGGITGDEMDEAMTAGFIPAGLGPRTLRTETAGLAGLAIIQYELGDMG